MIEYKLIGIKIILKNWREVFRSSIRVASVVSEFLIDEFRFHFWFSENFKPENPVFFRFKVDRKTGVSNDFFFN